MKLNYSNLKPLDIVCTTSLSPIALGIRVRQAGFKNAFNLNVCTHVGVVVPIGPNNTTMFGIAEMLDRLEINPLTDYTNNNYFGKRIVDIKRFELFQDHAIQKEAVDLIFKWWEEGKKYDYAGVIKYVLPFLKEKQNGFYCSEMIEWLALNIAKMDLVDIKHKGDNVTPYDLQVSRLLTSVKNWRMQ
jgi:hypothetical protein